MNCGHDKAIRQAKRRHASAASRARTQRHEFGRGTVCMPRLLAAGPAPGRLVSVGFFGRYVFDGRTWQDFEPGSGHEPDIEAPWLSVDIYDSDFATVRYEPPGPGSGTAYLGNTPRTYFDAESASVPIVSAELPELIASFLASDSRDEQPGDDADLSDADIFVQIKVSRFLRAVGFPLPQALPRP